MRRRYRGSVGGDGGDRAWRTCMPMAAMTTAKDGKKVRDSIHRATSKKLTSSKGLK